MMSPKKKQKKGKRKLADGAVLGSRKLGPILVTKKKKTDSLTLVGKYTGDSDSEDETQEKAVVVSQQEAIVEITGLDDEMIPVVPNQLLFVPQLAIRDTDDLSSMKLLPPEPSGKPNPEVQEKIRAFLQKKKAMGVTFNESMLQQKEFHNPYILSKIAETYKIDQTGSNYPRDTYNPRDIKESDKYDFLAKQQKKEEDKKAEERKNRTKVDFVPPSPHNLGGVLGGNLPANSASASSSVPSPVVSTETQQAITEAQIAAAKSKAKAAVKAKQAAEAAAAKVTVSSISDKEKKIKK